MQPSHDPVLPVLLLLVAVAIVGYSALGPSVPAVGAPSVLPLAAERPPGANGTTAPVAGASDPATAASPSETGQAIPPELSLSLENARQKMTNGDLPSAIRIYREALSAGVTTPDLLLMMAAAQLESGDAGGAVETLGRALEARPPEPQLSRALLLMSSAQLSLGRWEEVLRYLDISDTPDGLGDLVALRRAQAEHELGRPEAALEELRRGEMRDSTNRVLLEKGAQLAERAGDFGLAGELYARGAGFFGWTAERCPMYAAAGSAFQRAGQIDRAAEQYLVLLESYGWTPAAKEAGEELWKMGRLDSYHGGLLAINTMGLDEARKAFRDAAAGPYASAAAVRLQLIDETVAWQAAVEEGSPDGYRAFRDRYPRGNYAQEAWFQEGLIPFQAGSLSGALDVWEAASGVATGDGLARLLLWEGKALEQLGRDAEAAQRYMQAADTRPSGYYSVRARDLLAGDRRWPEGGELAPRGDEQDAPAAETWVAEWARGAEPTVAGEETRTRRGFGLLSLGMAAEASAEFNGVVAESRNPAFLLDLSRKLAEQQLWSPSSRAAARLVALSPARSALEAPAGIRRLVYPDAYEELVRVQAERRDLDPLLYLSLVHQESRYDPSAISLAGARGLTQVMPSTGRMISSGLGRPDFEPEELFRPALAVEFGASYLSDQLRAFEGDPFRALAAYNAGGGPVARWEASDPDLFVERIDYSETRNYVRQIYFHHAIYRGLK